MRLPSPLHPGTLSRRYKRFLADVVLDTREAVTAHCANPGSMLGLADPGLRVWLSRSGDRKRKLPWSLELVEADIGTGPTLVGINTGLPNRLADEAIAAGRIAELADYGTARREVRYGRNSRVDILLEDEVRAPCYVEVKNVHLLREKGLAEFPDAVTARGAKHLDELSDMVRQGARAVMLFIVQRGDADTMALARDIDPAYGAAFDRAQEAGVETLVYGCDVSHEEISVARPLAFAG